MTILRPTVFTSRTSPPDKPRAERTSIGMVIFPLAWIFTRVDMGSSPSPILLSLPTGLLRPRGAPRGFIVPHYNRAMQSRRNFISHVATGLAGTLATKNVLGANDRIRLGIIGAGDRGREILQQAVSLPG